MQNLVFSYKPNNHHDPNAVAIIHDNLRTRRVVGHVPLHYSVLFKQFLALPHHRIRCCVTGDRVNRGLGCGLEVPVEYIFIGDVKAINWLLGRVEKMDKALDGRVQKCMK